WKGPGAKVGDVKTTEVLRVYTEEVRRAEPELLVRTFERSTRSEHHPQAAADPVNTSLHGRRLLVAGLERRPDEPFELSKDDRDLLRLERLAAAMLPTKGVAALKERWTVPAAAMGEALFGSFVA